MLRTQEVGFPFGHVVVHPLDQQWQCIRANFLNGMLSIFGGWRWQITAATIIATDIQPLTQFLAVTLRLLRSRPKRDETSRRQKARSQNNDDPSSAHTERLSEFARNENSFTQVDIAFPTNTAWGCLFIAERLCRTSFCFSAAREWTRVENWEAVWSRAAEKQKGLGWSAAFYKQGTPSGVTKAKRRHLFQPEIGMTGPAWSQKSKIHPRSSLDHAECGNNYIFTEALMSGTSASNSPAMKKRTLIGIAIAVVVLIGVLAIIFVSAREPISLTFLEYQSLRARLRLTNNSGKTITYLTHYSGDVALDLPKTFRGWTNSSKELVSLTGTDGATGKTTPFYIYADAGFMTNGSPGDSVILHAKELKPGESAEIYASLQADGSPTRVGTLCIVPQGELARQFGRWMDRVKRWCRMRTIPPGVVEVWCSQPLQDRSSLKPGTNWYDL
jgi:hypothetical protein